MAKPTINYLNFSDFKGNYTYANNFVLGGTSFTLADLVDVALYPDIIADTTLTDSVEGVPSNDGPTGTGPTTGQPGQPDYQNPTIPDPQPPFDPFNPLGS